MTPEADAPDTEETETAETPVAVAVESVHAEDAAPVEDVPAEEPVPVSNKKWYIIKVTSGREESIKAAIERKVRIEGLEPFFGQVHIPVERVQVVKKVKETKNGETTTKEKRVTKETKKYPGYLMAEVEYCDAIQYLFRETSGVGDFVTGGLGRIPSPMEEIDVQRMLGENVPAEEGKKGKKAGKTIVKLDYEKGDKVRAREGAFANMEGEVKDISIPKDSTESPKVTVEVTIFGRPVQIELEHWQVDKV